MIPELGLFALILAFCFAFLQFAVPSIGIYKKNMIWMESVRSLALGQCFFVILSFLALTYAFVQSDFSVAYVAQHSNSQLPLAYKISAVWAGHEGSFLLWILIFNLWTVMVIAFLPREMTILKEYSIRILIVQGVLSFGFLLFLLTTSNPFLRFLPEYPIDGRDLNPLLQDPGLIIHPPILYLGYVGLSIPFSAAISMLWMNKIEIAWLKWMRSWVLGAFSFLTLGIALGSWWAYYELGWGGWWFWDPVENASFMPWLISIALIHCLMVSEKRGAFLGLTLFLAILGFSLSLLGTFLVRSGIVASVHAFANDPKRGILLLQFITLIIGTAFLLFAIRAKKSTESISNKTTFFLFSREMLILLSALLLLISCLSILLGTLFPMMYEVIFHQKTAIGPSYFNRVFVPLILPVLLCIPLGPLMQWGQNGVWVFFKKIKWFFVLSFVLSILFSVYIALGLGIGIWVGLGTLKSVFDKARKRGGVHKLTLGAWGMVFAHLGMAISVIGISLVIQYHIERDVKIAPTQSVEISGYKVNFESIKAVEGNNYVGYQGHFRVLKKDKKVADLFPEKLVYVIQESALSETAIDAGIFRDIYIALGERLTDGSWSVRVYYKPFVRWIWFGAIMMAIGGLFSAIARRSQTKNG